MNHPKPEDWVPYLYGQVKPDERRQLNSHLKNCPECRGEVEGWKRSVHRLGAWKLPRGKTPLERFAPALRTAAAAILVLAAGVLIGRSAGSAGIADKVRARLEPELRQALRLEMAQMVQQEVGRTSSAILFASSDQTEKLLTAYNAIIETRRAEDLERLYLA